MKKRILSILLCITMVFGVFPSLFLVEAATVTGTCGDSLTWSFDTSNNTLTISGVGEMTNYSMRDMPWYGFRSSMRTLIVESNVTSIGSYAFYECTGLTSVVIPQSVKIIGQGAFEYCSNLERIVIPFVSSPIYFNVLHYCGRLKDVYFYGTENEWNSCQLSWLNGTQISARIHYYTVVSEQSATCGNGVSAYSYWSNTNPIEYIVEPTILEGSGLHTPSTTAVIINLISPTCTEDGSYDSVVYCSVCDEELSRESITVPATGHTPGEPIIENTIPPACLEEGSYDSAVYCLICGEELSRETVIVPATDHTPGEPIIENTIPPTCLEDGNYDSVVYCSVCGEELSRETVTVPATGHTSTGPTFENTVAPTCTTPGHFDRVIYCSVCGEELNRRTIISSQATGHTPSEPVTENYYAPTCTYSGRYDSVVYCSMCSEELSRETIMVYATGHRIKAMTVEPTCTDVGYTNYICQTCGNLIGQTTIIPAKGHTPGSPVAENEVAPTCSHAQQYDNVVYCTACGEEISRETITVPGTETEHTFVDYRYNYDATETADGTKTAKCVYCDATDTIPALGTRITNSLKDAKLSVSRSEIVYYGSSATISAKATGVPSDYYLIICEGNQFIAKGNNESVSCVVENITEDRVFTVKIVDQYGNTKTSANTQKNINLKVRTSFIYRLIEFFRRLFSIISLTKQTV